MPRILKNSYVIFFLSFILLFVIFYIFKIGSTQTVKPDGTIHQNANWKYPLAIALVIWVIWNFFLYPPPEEIEEIMKSKKTYGGNCTNNQKINMDMWI